MAIRKTILGGLLSIISSGCFSSEEERMIGKKEIADNERIVLHSDTPLLNGYVWNYSVLRDGDHDGKWDLVEKYRGNTLVRVYIKEGHLPGQSTSIPLEVVTEKFFTPYQE